MRGALGVDAHTAHGARGASHERHRRPAADGAAPQPVLPLLPKAVAGSPAVRKVSRRHRRGARPAPDRHHVPLEPQEV